MSRQAHLTQGYFPIRVLAMVIVISLLCGCDRGNWPGRPLEHVRSAFAAPTGFLRSTHAQPDDRFVPAGDYFAGVGFHPSGASGVTTANCGGIDTCLGKR